MTAARIPALPTLLPTLLALALLSCSGPWTLERFPTPPELTSIDAVVLLQPEIYFRGMGPCEHYQKWMDLVHTLSRTSPAVVVSPDEYEIYTTSVLTDFAHETTAAPLLERYGADPAHTIALRFRLVETWQQGASIISRQEKTVGSGGATFVGDFEFTAEAYHFSSGQALFTVTVQLPDVQGENATDSDLRPELSRFANQQFTRLVNTLVSDYRLPRRPTPPSIPLPPALTYVENPLECRDDVLPDLPSLDMDLAGKDDLEKEALLRTRLAYRYPALDRPAIQALLAAGPALLVRTVPAGSLLRTHDLITAADGFPVTREFQLDRALAACATANASLTLRVLRDGTPSDVRVPCSR